MRVVVGRDMVTQNNRAVITYYHPCVELSVVMCWRFWPVHTPDWIEGEGVVGGWRLGASVGCSRQPVSFGGQETPLPPSLFTVFGFSFDASITHMMD